MHTVKLSSIVVQRVMKARGKLHAFETLDAAKTALVVIDMQNYFMKPGFMGEVPIAREIVPNVNRLAAAVRATGGRVIWLINSTTNTRDTWGNMHNYLLSPERREHRFSTMDETHEGCKLWRELDVKDEDERIAKNRYSAFLQGSSHIEKYLRANGLDTLLIAGTATNVCCESTARDAMMLNFKTVMVSDATATWSDEEHNASLSAFLSNFGDVKTVDECIATLRTEGLSG